MAAHPIDRVVAWVSRRKLYSLVVLGPEAVGKTTLLNSWRGTWQPDGPYRPTQATRTLGTARLAANGRRVMLPELKDVSGRDTALTQWQEQTQLAQVVVYLVNAEHLVKCERERATVEEYDQVEEYGRILDDAGQISRWRDAGGAEKCIVAVTHCDMDSRFAELGEQEYLGRVEKQLDPVVYKLGGPGLVKIVTGSLDTRGNAQQLTDRIVEQL
ncbi:GTPase domain-containing protein [Streptomyces populi]